MGGKELFAPDLLDHEMASVALKKSAAGYPEAARQALGKAASRILSGARQSV